MPRAPPETVKRKHAQKRDQVLFFTSRTVGPRPLDEILAVVPESFRDKTRVLYGWIRDDNKQRYVLLFPDAESANLIYSKPRVTDEHHWISRRYHNFTLQAKQGSSDALKALRKEQETVAHIVANTVFHDLMVLSNPSPLAKITPNWMLIQPHLRDQLDSVYGASFVGVGMTWGQDEHGFPSTHLWVRAPFPEPQPRCILHSSVVSMAADNTKDLDKTQANNVAKLGEYKLVRTVGEGTFGKVKLAIHSLTGHKVAMKFISKAKINAMKMRTRVSREVEYLRMLRHPHIIKLYEVISTPTDIIMVIEYAGGELFNYIVEHGKMSESQARRFFQQIMTAISYSHQLKIVHRDLKPENVLLDENLNVKIVDFGLSNIMTDGDFLKTSCGSPNYAAPEVISGKLYAGPEIDVWSCGVILYVMLCGRLPFEDENVPQLFHKISSGIYHLPSYLSPDAKSIIQGMLAVDPVKRLTVPEIIALPWFNVDLPAYLRPQPQQHTGPFLGTLSSLISPQPPTDREIKGLGKINQVVVDELAGSLGLPREEIEAAIMKDNDNAVKIAYMLCNDRRRTVRELTDLKEEDEEKEETMVQPYWAPGYAKALNGATAALPTAIPARQPGRQRYDQAAFSDDEDDEFDEDDEEDEEDYGAIDWTEENTFAVLDTSLVGRPNDSSGHHLTDYASARSPSSSSHNHHRSSHHTTSGGRSSKSQASSSSAAKQPRWHFGIRSRSPPMEVMLEIYQTLKALGMEWKQKGGQWSLDNDDPDRGEEEEDEHKWSKESLDIYFVETRCRVREVVVRMDLQLYQVDAANYLVDFRNKGYYKADLNTDKQFNRIVRPKRSRANSTADSSGAGEESLNGDEEAVDDEDDAASEKSKDLDKGIVD
ncbi:Protein kinase, partial [Tulasnella sp. 427]